jgi:hypothetical protein
VDWLRREEAMKTAGRENRNCWAAVSSLRVDGAVGQNRPCLITWGWKEENLQPWGELFLLTSPLIEPIGFTTPEVRIDAGTHINTNVEGQQKVASDSS